jgi:PAS domain S-box-containing protein
LLPAHGWRRRPVLFRDHKLGNLDLAALFDASPNPYVIFDTDLTIVGCNGAYLREVGRTSRDEIVGRGVFEAFPSDPDSLSGRLLRGSLEKVLSEKVADHLALIPYDTSGAGEAPNMRYWSATHTPLFAEGGELAFILQHTVDVTELQTLRARDAKGSIAEAGVLERAQAVQAENEEALAEIGQLRTLFQQAPGFMAVLEGPDHVFTLANDAYRQIIGHRDVVGKPVAVALPEVVDQGFVDLLDQVVATGEPFHGRSMPILLQRRPGDGLEQTFLDFVYQPIRDGSGKPVGIFVQGHDVTDQKRAEAALARQGEMLRLAQEAGGIGTFEWDIRSGVLRGSPAFKRLYGIDPARETIPISEFTNLVHPDDRRKLATDTGGQIEDRVQRTEYRVLVGETVRWIGRQGVLIHGADGEPERVLGAAFDLTDRKAFEAQLQTIAHEAAHRVKNMLAMVQAVVGQTLRREPDRATAQRIIGDRLVALSQAQDALTVASGKAAGLAEVVKGAVALHTDLGRIETDGPDLPLDAKTVLGLGLMLHELGTNAIKYGALSGPDGQVRITWDPISGEHGDCVRLIWRERGGPPVRPPERKGFGSSLIERGLAHRPGNVVDLDYHPDGLVCTAVFCLNDEQTA